MQRIWSYRVRTYCYLDLKHLVYCATDTSLPLKTVLGTSPLLESTAQEKLQLPPHFLTAFHATVGSWTRRRWIPMYKIAKSIVGLFDHLVRLHQGQHRKQQHQGDRWEQQVQEWYVLVNFIKWDIVYLIKLLQAPTVPVVHRVTRSVTQPTYSLETQEITANLTVSDPQGTNVHEASTHSQSTRLVDTNLRTFGSTTAEHSGDEDQSQGPEEGYSCPLCWDKRTDLSCLRCGHVFCTLYVHVF